MGHVSPDGGWGSWLRVGDVTEHADPAELWRTVKRDMEDALRASGHASVVVGATARTAEPHAAETAAQDGVPVVATPSGGIRPAVQQTHSHSRKASTGSTTLGTGGAGVVRASGVERDRSGTASPVAGGPERHARSGSVLSASTRGMLGAYDDSRISFSGGGGGAARRSVDTQGERTVPTDEFDQLVKSGQTVRVSLTPSRLKTFDVSGGERGVGDLAQPVLQSVFGILGRSLKAVFTRKSERSEQPVNIIPPAAQS